MSVIGKPTHVDSTFEKSATHYFLEVKRLSLPQPSQKCGMPILDLLHPPTVARFISDDLSAQQLSDLLWAAHGNNRRENKRSTSDANSPSNDLAIYLALRQGLYRFDRNEHALQFLLHTDVRAMNGYRQLADVAPLALIIVADQARMTIQPASELDKHIIAYAATLSKNIDAYCASVGLASKTRGWFERNTLAATMRLASEQSIVLMKIVNLAGSSAVTRATPYTNSRH